MEFVQNIFGSISDSLSKISPLYYLFLFLIGAFFTLVNIKIINEKIESKSKNNKKELGDIKREISHLKGISENISVSNLPKIFNAINDLNSSLQAIQQTKIVDERLFTELTNEIKYFRQNNQGYPKPIVSSHHQSNFNNLHEVESLQRHQNEIDEIINNFNNSNNSYFENSKFFFLKPTSATSLGSEGVGINAMSIVEFEEITENTAKSSYIGFSLQDQKTYLIPNLLNNRWKQILQSDENKIFDVDSSNFLLVDAATIEGSRNGIWRLEKSGKFQ